MVKQRFSLAIVFCIIAAFLAVLYYLHHRKSVEGFQTNEANIMIGPYIGTPGIPITDTKTLANGQKIYLAQWTPSLTMMINRTSGEARYYGAKVADYEPSYWNNSPTLGFDNVTATYDADCPSCSSCCPTCPQAAISYQNTIPNVMFGATMGGDYTIQDINFDNAGNYVYLTYKDPWTWAINSKGETRTYYGQVSDYLATNWDTYVGANNSIVLRYDKNKPSLNATLPFRSPLPNVLKGAVSNNQILIDRIDKDNDGNYVYMGHDTPYTKLANTNGVCKYFQGPISIYTPSNWDSYITVTNGSYVPAYTINPPESKMSQMGSKLAVPNVMYGPLIGRNILIERIDKDNAGNDVYIAYDGNSQGGYTRMVNSLGKGRYYSGPISNYLAGKWNSYTDVTGGHFITMVDDPPKPLPQPPVILPSNLILVPNIMYGPGIERDIPIQHVDQDNAGNTVFIAYDGNDGNTKMVNANGVGKYFKGFINLYSGANWNSYSTIGTNVYQLRVDTIAPQPDPAPSYSSTWCRCNA
jgi:NAD-dependent dihydropyrimidine dehydrogenase PreA subunit